MSTSLSQESNEDQAPPEKPVKSTVRKRYWLWLFLIIPILFLCSVAWLTGTETGFQYLFRGIDRFSNNAYSIKHVSGTLWKGFSAKDINIQTSSVDIKLDTLIFEWAVYELFSGTLHIKHIGLGNLHLTTYKTESSPPASMPESLSLPVNIQLDRLSLNSLKVGSTKAILSQSTLAYHYTKGLHKLQLTTLQSKWGTAYGTAQFADKKPYSLSGKVNLDMQLWEDELCVSGEGVLAFGGDLVNTKIDLHFKGPRSTIDMSSELDPFAAETLRKLRRIDLRLSGLNPRAFDPRLPKALINAAIIAEPKTRRTLSGGISLINSQADTLPNKGIPIKLIAGELQVEEGKLSTPALQIQLINGNISTTGNIASNNLALDTKIQEVLLTDFGAPLDKQSLSGSLNVSGKMATPSIQFNIKTNQLSAQGLLSLDKTSATGRPLNIQKIKLSANHGGTILIDGHYIMGKTPKFDINGKIHQVNPERFWPATPKGNLNATLTVKGEIAEQLQLLGKLNLSPSQLSGAPLSGNAITQIDGKRLSGINLDLHLGNNTLFAKGAWGQSGDRLNARIAAPNLGLLGMGFNGAINGYIDLTGTPQHPMLDSQMQADRLSLPGLTIQQANLKGKLSGDRAAPLTLNVKAQGIRAGAVDASQINIDLSGTQANHRITSNAQFRLAQQAYQFFLNASGNISADDKMGWRGQISRFELSGDSGIKLLNPLTAQISPQRATVSAARLALLGGTLNIDSLNWQKGQALVTRGKAGNISLAALSTWVPALKGQNLVLGADWNISYGGSASGTVNIFRQSGDFAIPKNNGRNTIQAGLSVMNFKMQLRGGQSNADINIVSRFGSILSQGQFNHGSGLPNMNTPLNATIKADVPALNAMRPFLPIGLELNGSLKADIGLRGTLSSRLWSGTINGKDLSMYDRGTGVKLANGTLAVRMDRKKLILNQLRFTSVIRDTHGDVSATGTAEYYGDIPIVQAKVNFNRFSVFNKPGRRLVVSGSSDLDISRERGIVLNGKLKVNYGRIDLPKSGAPGLSDDVVVVGETLPEPSAFSKLALNVNMQLDLGNRFYFAGEGLNVLLGGVLNVNASPGLTPAATGEVKIIEGRYKAYGQDLDIAAGSITFNNTLSNPTLNVGALRRMSPVGAGVEVTGSVSQPRVRLVANEPMSDKEKLAWLVLGRSSGGSQDDEALAAAAGAFLAGNLNDHFGGLIDDIGISSKEARYNTSGGQVNPAEQIITVGKQFTREIYIGYEYGISSADSAIKLIYILSRGWSFILRAGEDSSGVETRFTYRFD